MRPDEPAPKELKVPPPAARAISYDPKDPANRWLHYLLRAEDHVLLDPGRVYSLRVMHWWQGPLRPAPGTGLPDKLLPALCLLNPDAQVARVYGWPSLENWQRQAAAFTAGQLAAAPLRIRAKATRPANYYLPVWQFEYLGGTS